MAAVTATPRQRLTALIQDLVRAVDKDAEQEVQGIAIPVLDAVLTELGRGD